MKNSCKVISELILKRIEIFRISFSGIGKPFLTLRIYIPIVLVIVFMLVISILNMNDKNLIDFIKQINSLVGIILGFSIASFAIFISINNDKLDKKSKNSKYTYRKIGGSLFFYNVELSLFISLIGIALIYMDLQHVNFIEKFFIFKSEPSLLFNITYDKWLKTFAVLTYMFLFFQLILNLFFSSLYLQSSLKSGDDV